MPPDLESLDREYRIDTHGRTCCEFCALPGHHGAHGRPRLQNASNSEVLEFYERSLRAP